MAETSLPVHNCHVTLTCDPFNSHHAPHSTRAPENLETEANISFDLTTGCCTPYLCVSVFEDKWLGH